MAGTSAVHSFLSGVLNSEAQNRPEGNVTIGQYPRWQDGLGDAVSGAHGRFGGRLHLRRAVTAKFRPQIVHGDEEDVQRLRS
jgi:hypothetical protein